MSIWCCMIKRFIFIYMMCQRVEYKLQNWKNVSYLTVTYRELYSLPKQKNTIINNIVFFMLVIYSYVLLLNTRIDTLESNNIIIMSVTFQ
jgi:hypothetical protein